MIKNNPYHLLEKADIKKDQLSEEARQALDLFDDTLADLKQFPDDDNLKNTAEQIGKSVMEFMETEIKRINGEAVSAEHKTQANAVKKQHSKKTMEKAVRTLDDLEFCRQRLREDRKRKVETGEIAKPKRKTLTTKLRAELLKTVGLIPKNLKGNTDVLTQTRKAILKFLNELKGIWGLNRIKPIEDDLNQRFKKLEEEAGRMASEN